MTDRLIDARRHTAGVDLEWMLSSGQFWLFPHIKRYGQAHGTSLALKLPAALAECGKQRLDTAWIQPCNARSPIKEIVLAEKLSRFDWINR